MDGHILIHQLEEKIQTQFSRRQPVTKYHAYKVEGHGSGSSLSLRLCVSHLAHLTPGPALRIKSKSDLKISGQCGRNMNKVLGTAGPLSRIW